MANETAFVIVKDDVPGPLYLADPARSACKAEWTYNPHEARRFPRRDEALLVLVHGDERDCHIEEHMWCDGPSAEARADA